jgi:hypothetical protein
VPPDQPSQPIINIDFGPLIDLLRQIADAVNPTIFVPAAVQAFGNLMYSAIRNLFVAIWNGLLLSIPHELSDRFAPVVAMMPNPGAIAVGGLTLAIALLGLSTYVRGITGRGGIFGVILGRVMVYTAVLSILPWIISRAIDIEQQVASRVAISGLISIIPDTPSFIGLDMLIALFFMFIFGVRLWLKLASNIIHIMVAIVWAPIALVCGLIPESSWVAELWIREFTGRLAGAVLATIATALGLALALTKQDLIAIVFAASAFLAAHDLVDWLARTPGSHMGGVVGFGARLVLGAAGGGGRGAIGANAPIPRNQITTRAEQFGYD